MTLHQFLFPACDTEIQRLRGEAGMWKGRADKLESELKSERRRNLKREDELVNRLLTKNNQFAIAPREFEEPTPEPAKQQDLFDQTRDEQITARFLELKEIYAQRGHQVSDPEIRAAVEREFDYLMDDDRVEM